MKKKLYIIILLLTIIILLSIFVMLNKKEFKLEEPLKIPEKVEKPEKVDEKKEDEKKEEPIVEEPKKEETVKLPTKASITDKKISFDSSFKNDDKDSIKEFLKEFFERYYDIIADLQYKDISDMFVNQENAYIYKTALELLIENRKQSALDLTLNNVKYELSVKNYKNSDNKISFTVLENCSYNFASTKAYPTAVYNIENKFELVKEDDKYKINSFNKVQDFYVMITDIYKKSDNYEESLNKIKANYLKTFETENKKIMTMRTNYLNGNYQTLKCDHGFNREKAYEYAITWVGRRNTSKWHTYSANCVNFVSQVMYAGGIPMDHFGKEQWKWYSTKKNTANTATGFVYSWTYVPSIVSYFKNNTGFGLCGKYNENIYLGDKGDVVVVGTTGPTRHVVSVIGQVKNEKGEVVDLLVNSNTVDLEYFPLSAYAYPYKILMKVYGWNN